LIEESAMGRWGFGIFENDTACDFKYVVVDGGGLAAIEQALDRVLAAGDRYLEVQEADEALAAADIIARLLGSFGQQDAYTEDIDAWVKSTQAKPSSALVEKALQAIQRILAEHFRIMAENDEDTEDFADWKREVNALTERLRPFAPQ
jgi:hypothetical protein